MDVSGLYCKTIFRNKETGYTMFLLKLNTRNDSGRNIYTCQGIIPFYAVNTPLTLSGEFVKGKGNDVFAINRSVININTNEHLISFLTTCLPAGVGSVVAGRIVVLLNEEKMKLQDFIKRVDAVSKLSKVNGLSEAKAAFVINKATELINELSLMTKLAPFGVTFRQINKMCKINGQDVIKQLNLNPYKVMSSVGISFSSADLELQGFEQLILC